MMRPKFFQRIAKRFLDILFSLILLVVLSPLFVCIAVAIRISSGKPVLYEWRVVGQGGKPFTGYKFRTMVQNADAVKNDLLDRNEMRGPVFKMREDPRVTYLGKLLRKFTLDELPQLWNVLKGDMSLVGPRPPLQSEYARFSEWQKQKLSVRPGMTSLWQVRGKPNDFNAWVRLDLEYIEHWSLALDLKILFQTAIIVFAGKNY